MKRTHHLQSMQRLPDQLAYVPDEYYRTGSVQGFMEACSVYILNFARLRLTRDPDIAGDFYVWFYERAAQCLEAYKTRQHTPFTAYFVTYLRLHFYNFIRERRKNHPEPETGLDESRIAAPAETPQRYTIADRLTNLPMDLLIPLKLHYGIELTGHELKALALSRGPHEVQIMLKEMARRKLALFREQEKLEDRAARLTGLLQRENTERLRRWKQRVLEALSRPRPVFSYMEIARLLGTSKSTIARRIEGAKEMLRMTDAQAV